MWNFWDILKMGPKVVAETSQPQVVNDTPKPDVTTAKPKIKKPKKKKVKEEPVVEIKQFDFDPKDPRVGSIELDWNNSFIDLLKTHGYASATDEEIVDLWLNDVCRTIISNQYQGSTVRSQALAGTTVVSRKDLGQGKTEVS